MRARRSLPAALAIAFAATLSLAIAHLLYARGPRLEDVSFGFGALVRSLRDGRGLCVSLAGVPRACASRAPLVPLALASVAAARDRPLAALLFKNVLFAGAATFVVTPVASALAARARWLSRSQQILLALACLITTVLNPQALLTAGEIAYEEGYTTWMLAIAFAAVLAPGERAPPLRACATLCVAALPLTKSSMLPVALVLAIQLALRDAPAAAPGVAPAKRWSRALAPLALLVLAVSFWTARNGIVSGRFSPGTSWDGYNLWKGNNEAAALYYPARSLDLVSDRGLLVYPAGVDDEWAQDDYARDQAASFVWSHPGRALLLAGAKARVFALDLREGRRDEGMRSKSQALKDLAQLPAMLLTRAVFLAALFYALAIAARRGDSSARAGVEERATAQRYLIMVTAFALPYLVGFACVRHFVPLIVPTWLFVLRELGLRGRERVGAEGAERAALGGPRRVR